MPKRVFLLATALLLNGCVGVVATAPVADRSADSAIPPIPAPAAVSVDARSSALLVLDISTAICQPNPACTATVPAIASLVAKAREAKVPVLYSTTVNPKGPPPILAAVAPQAGEPTVVARANKFADTNLEELLKQRKASTLVIVGSAANGAVLYTSFHANARGFTVVAAEDGLSSPVPINTTLARYQLLNQPGAANPSNKPLAERAVTLSRSDLITFK